MKILNIELACMICLMAALTQPACCEKILVHTQEQIALDNNTTMAIEDADSESGMIWVKVYYGEDIVQSRIVKIGECFMHNETGTYFTPQEIYAGGGSDLVALDFNGSIPASAEEKSTSNQTAASAAEEKSPGLSFIEALLLMASSLVIFTSRKKDA